MKIFISAGDPSGDLHGSNLIKEIKLQSPATQIFGFGGSKMASSAVIYDKLADKSILGFWEPIKNIPRLKNNFSIAKNFFSKEKPDIFIPIDYYGFNIHLVKEAHRQNIPIIYFISPQGLIHKSNEFKTIGIMPGSRIQEIKNHFHIFVEAFKIINKTFKDSKVIIPVFSDDVREYIRKNFFLDFNKVEFVQYNDYEKRAKMDICITSSGTATVENMILGVPMVIVYKTSFITYHIAKLLINIPYIGMVNILSGKMICPELIQYEATPKNIAEKCLEILKGKVIYQKIQNELAETKKLLGSPGATKRAANIILRDSNG